MTAAVAGQHRVSLLYIGAKAEPAQQPDAWVPDSSSWLLRLASDAPGFRPTGGSSIATSPVVLAATTATARSLGWPGRTQALPELLGRVATDKALRPGIVDPAQDAAGLSGLLALSGAAGADAAGAHLRVGALRAFAANSSGRRADMLQKFTASAVGLTPLSEEDVIAYNAGRPAIEVAALYPTPAAPALDYPLAVMPGVDPAKAVAAEAFRGELAGDAYRNDLARAGLRAPDGSTGDGFPAPSGAPGTVTPPARPADPATTIAQILGSWAAITLPGRQLAVFDVSGSMKDKVATAGGLTRAQITQRVAAQGLALLDDRWSVGNWTFSTGMNGKLPWKENVPITPLTTERRSSLLEW